MIPFTPDERRAQFAPSQNVGGAVDRDVLDIIGGQPQPTMAAQVDYDVPDIKPVDPDVVDIVNQSQVPLMSSLMGASRVNPDQAAEAKRLGSQIGVGQDIALRNMDDVRQRAFMAEVQRRDIARANPVLAGFLTDRTFANEASDDIGVLANIENAWSYLEELPGEFMAGFRTGQIQVDAGKVGSTALLRGSVTEDEQRQYDAYQKELQKLAGEPGFWREAGAFIGQMERTGEDVVKGAAVGGVAGAGATLVAGQLGPQFFLPEEIVTVPAGVMFGITAGATSAMFTSSARTMAGLNYMKNLEAGMDSGVSRATALGVGVIGGAFEAYGTKLVAAPFKGVWTRLVSEAASEAVTRPTVGKAVANAGLAYATGVGGEIGTEVAQQVTEIAFDEIAGFASDPEFQSRFATAEGRQGIKDELREVIVRTALGISVIGGIGPGANLYVDTRRAGKAVKSQQAIQNTVDAINAAKLKQRDPAALEQFGDAALRSTTAFIRGTTMQSLVEASKVSRSELDAIIPGLSGQIQEAVNADNFVSLPLAQFGVRLAGTPLGDAMQPHMTIDPNAMTPTELEAFRANVEQFTELAATEYEAKTEAESAFVQEADQVFSSMRERLVAAGRDPALADIEALMHQAFVVTQAANRGMTPAQFEAESGLREIVGAEMPAAPLEQANQFDQAGQRRTDTPEFKAWSNNAAVIPTDQTEAHVFATSQPVVVEAFHGSTERGLRRFDVGRAVEVPGAIFFTSNQDVAAQYTYERAYGDIISEQPTGDVIRAYVVFENPLVYVPKGKVVDAIEMDRVVQQAKAAGHDGVIIKNIDDSIGMTNDMGDVYITWKPTNIKSTDNRGTWSRTSPNIMEQAAKVDGVVLRKAIREYAKGDISAEELMDDAGLFGLVTEQEVAELLEFDVGLAEAGASSRGGTTSLPGGIENRGQHPLLTLVRKREKERAGFTPAQRTDADYMAAVERGDMEAAQRMVDDAAYAAGYTVRAFHGTDAKPFDIFGNYDAYNFGDASYFSPDRKYAEDYAYSQRTGGGEPRVLNVALKLGRVFSPETNKQHLAMYKKWAKEQPAVHGYFAVQGPVKEPYGPDGVRNLINWEDQWWLVNKIREAGFDSFTTSESDGQTIAYGVLNANQIKLADPVTRDESGNVVPLSRRFDITSPRIFEQAAVQPRLMAVHNLSADNLAFADRMGGLAVPSIGVITEERGGVEGFGEITLIGTRDMADPATSRVFSSDAYSARFPRAEWPKVAYAKANKFVDQLRAVAARFEDRRIIDETFDAMVNSPDAQKVVNYWMRSMPVMALFLSEKGVDIAPILRERNTLSRLSWEAIDKLRPAYEAVDQQLAYDEMEASPEYRNLQEQYAEAVRTQYAGVKDDLGESTVEQWATQFTPTTLQRLARDMGQAERQTVDETATRSAIDSAIEPFIAEFKSWVDTKVRKQFGDPFIRIGRSRKPYTLSNIVDVMTSTKVRGEEKGMTFGAGAARAEAATEFVDLEQMREASKAAIVDPDEYSKAAKKSDAQLSAYRDAVIEYTTLTDWRGKSDTWAALDGSMRALATYGSRKRRDAAAMRRVLAKEGFASNRMPNELIEQAMDAAEALFNAPVPYFEAKPQRAVGLGEFAGAVIPSDANQQVRDILDRNGLAYMTYIAGDETDRQRAVRQMAQSPEARGETLFQAMPGRGPARGGYDPSRLKILFGKGADFTTGAHELTHYYVDYYTKQAMAGTAAPQMLADLDAMFKFMGVAGDTPEARLAAFNAMPFETARPLIEAITYNAEVYLFEGKAPSLELAGVFDRMLAFFRRAYKSLADFVTQQQEIYRREFGRELPALNDDLRAVFDRMLADERQIKQAQAVAQMRGQFTVKPEGMDDAEWAAYQEMAGEATNAAIADMTKASLRQMEWLSRARNRIVKELQARHTAQRKEVRERVQKEVQQEPLYRAMAFLRRGQVVAPDGTVTEAEGVHKIDRVLAAEFAPTVDLAALGGRYGVLQDDGLHPDIVAEMFGYPTGGTLLEALAAAKPMREAVEDRTDAEMLRLYGEMNTPEAREQEIQKALHNEARARLVGVELRFMGKIQQPVRVLMEAARQAAQQVIDRKRVGELRPSEFVAAEAKASREATAAMQDNKPDMAVRAKRAQLLNNQLAKAALEVKDEIDTDIRYLRRVLRDSNRQRMGADVADQIASLLDRFNIAPMTADEARRVGTLAEFLASLEDRGLVPDIAEAIGMRDTRIPYKNMTIGEFRELVDAVKQLEYVGKNERKILLAKEKAEFGAVRDQIVASVIENAGDRKANARTATTNIGRAVTAMKGFAAAHLKAASIVRILDGGKDGGPLWNYLIRSANEAGDSETSMRAEATADLTKILEPVFRAGKLGGKGVFYPSINRSLNREARLVVALNMGNAGNMQRLLDGEGWSMEAVMPVLQSLTEDELNTVQQIWDYFEKYRPMIGQKERRLYGKEPSWVEPQPLVVRSADGKTVTLRGGYYPIKYDPRASLRAETMSEADEAKRDLAGAYTTATTRRSFVKARVRKVEGRPLLYTLAGMYGGINDVIHDLTWHEWLIQANRLMRSNSVDDAVRNRYGPEYVAQLKNWIKDVAAGERGVQNEAEMALNFLRQGISSAGLGFNIVSAALQITGFNQSIVRVGARWIGRGIAYVAQNPMVAMREVNEKSEFMRNRSRTQFRELNEIRNMVQGQSVAMRRVQMGTYFLMMRMQRMVDVPTWHGAYEKAMYEGRDEETAIALADQAVIDSQGGGMVKDLARVERGGPAVKLFTVFYGYMNTVYNMAAVQTMTNKNKGKLAADYAMLFVVPVVLSYMLKQALIPRKGDEDEEWDMGKIGRELAAEQLSYLMGTMVIAREFGEVGKMIFGVEGPRMGYGGPAGLRAIGETYQFATQASQGEFDTAFRKSAVNMIGAFTGLPSAQVNRTLDGLEALYEGETKNVLAPLTGAKKR